MLVLVGLGNPGAKYANHRHNVGFMAVDAIADAYSFDDPKNKFKAHTREGTLSLEGTRLKTLILKPQTYMNESGQSVGELVRFYKLTPQNIIVFHDELDLAPGKLRIKHGGGNAGHNGLRSIDAHIGNDFTRARIGIGHPGSKAAVHNYVLGDFSKHDQDWLPDLLESMAKAAPHLVDHREKGGARFQSEVAHHMNPNQHTAKKTTTEKPAPAKANPPASASQVEAEAPSNPFQDALRTILPKKK